MLNRKTKESNPRLRALAGLREAGISVPQWAEANGFSVQTVKAVLYGNAKGVRGEAHRVAVALGIKAGSVVAPKGFKPVPVKARKLAVVTGGRA